MNSIQTATAYEEWCRDAMLPRQLSYGDHYQTWFDCTRLYHPSREGWDSEEIDRWLPLRRGTRTMPFEADGVREVWVPDERAWLDRLTAAGYGVSIGARFSVGLVAPRGPVIAAVNAVSWAHGMALCWAKTPEGLEHFRKLEAGR